MKTRDAQMQTVMNNIAPLCGFSKITEHTVDLVCERVAFLQSITGGLLRDDEGNPKFITYKDIHENMIGMECESGCFLDQRD